MKIGILTQPLHSNYGGILQNYALQQALIRLGHEPVTLDQRSKEYPKWRLFFAQVKGLVAYLLDSKHNRRPRYVLSKEEDSIIRKHLISFIEKYIRHSSKCAGSIEFKAEAERLGIDGFVVGSDQCWRPCYNMYIEDMFLAFANNLDNKKRVAYAASFGTDKWEFTPEQTGVCSALAKKFDLITVREKSGVDLCKQHLGVDAIHVVDPTLLLTKDDYIDLIKTNNVPMSEGTLFNYVLDPSQAMSCLIRKISLETGLKTFQVLPKYNEDHRTKKDVKQRIEDCVYPSPLAWIRAFMDAEMTIVDSFHGTVFSIIFNKPFWVVGNKERGMSRFTSLLSMFGLEDRLICEDDLEKLDYNRPIDWLNVNKLLAEKREQSLEILMKSLE